MAIDVPILLAALAISTLFVGGNVITMMLKKRHALVPTIGVGGSMEPALPGGVNLGIDHYPFSITEGDIVTYESDSAPTVMICHRVIEVDGNRIRIKGDNNDWCDGWFDKSDVVSKTLTVRGRPIYLPASPKSIRQVIRRNL